MDIYHIWCDLKAGEDDLAFVAAVRAYLDDMRGRGVLAGYRITRRKLGLAPSHLREFHLLLEFADLTQLDEAFGVAAGRADPVEGLHKAVYQMIEGIDFALYRDFPADERDEPVLRA